MNENLFPINALPYLKLPGALVVDVGDEHEMYRVLDPYTLVSLAEGGEADQDAYLSGRSYSAHVQWAELVSPHLDLTDAATVGLLFNAIPERFEPVLAYESAGYEGYWECCVTDLRVPGARGTIRRYYNPDCPPDIIVVMPGHGARRGTFRATSEGRAVLKALRWADVASRIPTPIHPARRDADPDEEES